MMRPWHTWTAFAVFLSVVLAAMGFVSLTVLRLDDAQATARRQAQQEELIRLALWRMDSALGPLVKDMGDLPYFFYRSFYPADRAYTSMFSAIRPGEVLLPSPLLRLDAPHIQLHFQIDPRGRFTSPQVPQGNMRDLAEAAYTTAARIAESQSRLGELAESIARDDLLAMLPERLTPSPTVTEPAVQLAVQTNDDQQPLAQQAEVQQQRSLAERRARVQRQMSNVAPSMSGMGKRGGRDHPSLDMPESNRVTDVSMGPVTPVWIKERLLLARRVTTDSEVYVQGCVLDWPGIRDKLCADVQDLLPQAKLVPLIQHEPASETRLLAELPVRLEPGAIVNVGPDQLSTVHAPLIIAWGCVLVAAVAIAILLAGSVTLSERRAAFVSAVTHEMRTPLTTVSMYADMLIKGMVPSEEKRKQYLETLRVEAHRLSHLIENVLAFSRLERVRHAARREPVTLGDLLDRAGPRLAGRAEQAGMELVIEAEPPVTEFGVYVDLAAVEQILFNLVDNACKYAASAADRRIHVCVARTDASATITVRDHGPGIAADEARRLFRPFSKSAQQAARTAPGVGLGLALSQRMARGMGGQLHLDTAHTPGASFVLTLPMG